MLFLVQNMKFSSSEDIEASAEAVFAALCDHAEFQQQMRRSGVSVVRMDELSKIGPGMSWEIDFKFRGAVSTNFFTGPEAQTGAVNTHFVRIRWAFGRCGRERGGSGA